jgi:hypothetical protein
MKLLFCPVCQDVKKLHLEMTFCNCCSSSGQYNSHINASYYGRAIPLGISNQSFSKALELWRECRKIATKGIEFDSFIIPDKAKTIRKY